MKSHDQQSALDLKTNAAQAVSLMNVLYRIKALLLYNREDNLEDIINPYVFDG